MAESNGSLKAANGQTSQPSQLSTKRSRSSRRRRGFVACFSNHVARLVTWFAILTLVFRCPSSLNQCDEASPYICKYYFQTKEFLTPHLKPYYDNHARPYVDLVQPYYETVNSNILNPAREYAVHYGSPYVDKAQKYGQAQWERTGQPQLHQLQTLANARYHQSVAPYLERAVDTLGPYYDIAKTNCLQMFYEYAVPGYYVIQPYAVTGYHAASDFTVKTAIPTGWWAFNKTYDFLDTTIGPQIRLVYIENVQPQLTRIGERLGRYKTGPKSRSSITPEKLVTDILPVASSFSKPTISTSATSSVAPESTETEAPTYPEEDFIKPVQAPVAENNENNQRKKAREMVADDLELWQAKFAAQADEGANDMEEKVDDISKRMIKDNAQTAGKSLVDELEALVTSQMVILKENISTIVASENSFDKAEEATRNAVRSAGLAIKKQAQKIRKWRQGYDSELHKTVVRVADTHFQILDETRGLALQQIGMKWAWTEGVTYKDWAKYHELKTTFGEWTEQLKQLIVTHPTLIEAQEAAAQVEDEAMEIAATAAKELGRLKQVARWKITAKDATDNFDSEAMKLAAEVADAAKEAPRVEKNVKIDATILTQTQKHDPSQTASDIAAGADKEAGNRSVDFDKTSPSGTYAEEGSTPVHDPSSHNPALPEKQSSNSLEEALSSASSAVSVDEDISATPVSYDSSVSDSISSLASETTSSEVDTTESLNKLIYEASKSLLGSTATIVANVSDDLPDYVEIQNDKDESEDITDEEEGDEEDRPPLSPKSATVKHAWLGAAAQEVPRRQPIIEDDDNDTDYVASVTNGARDIYAKAVSAAAEQYSSAASVVSAQIHGTPKPVHEQLFSSLSTGYDNAIAAASSRMNDAISAASNLRGTTSEAPKPTPYVDWTKVESIAAQRLKEGKLWAEVQYQSAIIALGLATPTPMSPSEKFYQQAKFKYYAGLGLAQDRYSSFIAAASSAMSSLTAVPTPTPTDFAGTASSIASVARASAASFAQGAQAAAGSVYSAATDNVAAAISAVDDSLISVIDGASEQVYLAGVALSETWDRVIASIEGQIYGETKQIGWYENLFKDASSSGANVTEKAADSAATASKAAKQYAAVTDLVSELISGKEPSFSESVISRLNAVYTTASSNLGSYASGASAAAVSVGEKVGSAASQATDAIRDKMHHHTQDEL